MVMLLAVLIGCTLGVASSLCESDAYKKVGVFVETTCADAAAKGECAKANGARRRREGKHLLESCPGTCRSKNPDMELKHKNGTDICFGHTDICGCPGSSATSCTSDAEVKVGRKVDMTCKDAAAGGHCLPANGARRRREGKHLLHTCPGTCAASTTNQLKFADGEDICMHSEKVCGCAGTSLSSADPTGVDSCRADSDVKVKVSIETTCADAAAKGECAKANGARRRREGKHLLQSCPGTCRSKNPDMVLKHKNGTDICFGHTDICGCPGSSPISCTSDSEVKVGHDVEMTCKDAAAGGHCKEANGARRRRAGANLLVTCPGTCKASTTETIKDADGDDICLHQKDISGCGCEVNQFPSSLNPTTTFIGDIKKDNFIVSAAVGVGRVRAILWTAVAVTAASVTLL